MRRKIPESELQRIRDDYERERLRRGVDYGMCFCGCQSPAPLASQTAVMHNKIKDEPQRFIRNHHTKFRPFSDHGVNTNEGYCECGCGLKTSIVLHDNATNGHVAGKPYRYLPGHARRKSPIDYTVDSESGCWMWQRGTVQSKCDKYGQMTHNGRQQYAHRHYYEQAKGPIPDGWQIHHLCVEFGFGSTLCVNPDHLKPLPNADNSRRSKTTKLSMDDVIEIRRMLDAGEYLQQEIAEIFDVHPNHISSINTGHRWKYN